MVKKNGVQKLTPARALIAEMIRRYWVLGIECTLLEIQKLAWFLERNIEELNSSNPLKLHFVANKYGPYANRLYHLLNSLDGSPLFIKLTPGHIDLLVDTTKLGSEVLRSFIHDEPDWQLSKFPEIQFVGLSIDDFFKYKDELLPARMSAFNIYKDNSQRIIFFNYHISHALELFLKEVQKQTVSVWLTAPWISALKNFHGAVSYCITSFLGFPASERFFLQVPSLFLDRGCRPT